MSGQLLSPLDLAPSDLARMPVNQRAGVWLEMLDAGYKLVVAGLTHEKGASDDVDLAYRQWYVEQMNEHDRMVKRMLSRMQGRQ
jgi:hypothetical protein